MSVDQATTETQSITIRLSKPEHIQAFLDAKDIVVDDFDDLRMYQGEASNSEVVEKLSNAYAGELTLLDDE